jgi:CheY-like chemotaxis protein
LNLLSNSLKFTEKGEIRVNCSVLYNGEDSQRLQIQVVDTGIGMSTEYMAHLFDKFSQEDESVTRKFGGTGLGMSISKQIIELMGGTIQVQSAKNEGTTISFTIKFPKGTVSDLPQSQYNSIDTHILKGKRILLVEDNEMNRFLANTVLSQYGAQVDEAGDGVKAIDKISHNPFDIILMDVQMPVKDGLETTRYIRSNIDNNIPIIALTANAYKKEEEACIGAGMNDFISKPFEEEKLIHTVAKWLGRSAKTAPLTEEKAIVSNNKLYDLSMLRTVSKGDESFVIKMVQLFVTSIPVALHQMQQAYQAKDWKEISGIAHRIKPSIQSMGITALVKDIEVL